MNWFHSTNFALWSLIALAVGREMPEKLPIRPQEWWTWLFNSVQQLLSMRGIPTRPEGPAQPK